MTPKPEDLIASARDQAHRRACSCSSVLKDLANAYEALLSERDQLKLERDTLEHRLLRYQKVVEAARLVEHAISHDVNPSLEAAKEAAFYVFHGHVMPALKELP